MTTPLAKFIRKQKRNGASSLERKFELYWKSIGGPALEREYVFHSERKWRFDFAHVDSKTAIEIEGGIFIGGRHTRALGFRADCEKGNEANFLDWHVFRLTGDQITIETLRRIENKILKL